MRSRRFLITGFGVFLLGVLGFVVFFWANFKGVIVRGPSMEPTFESGRHLLMSKAYWLVGEIQRNDIVVSRTPGSEEFLIKRVKGLPGDVIDFKSVPNTWRLGMGEYKVPEDTFYLLGDNRTVSQDSRDYGPIDQSDILGKVVVYGNETWLTGISALALVTIVSSGLASIIDAKQRARNDQ